jgi:hypothetical protein
MSCPQPERRGFSSALSVDHFIKKTSLIRYSPAAFRKEARDIICLANVEGLGAHANAIQVRLKEKDKRRINDKSQKKQTTNKSQKPNSTSQAF